MSGLLKQLEKKLSIVLILMSLSVVLMLSGCSGTEEESRPALVRRRGGVYIGNKGRRRDQ